MLFAAVDMNHGDEEADDGDEHDDDDDDDVESEECAEDTGNVLPCQSRVVGGTENY